jgi:hypothetical protein
MIDRPPPPAAPKSDHRGDRPCHPKWLVRTLACKSWNGRHQPRRPENSRQVSKFPEQRSPTPRPRLRSEEMAPDGAILVTATRHRPGAPGQVGAQLPHSPAQCRVRARRRHGPLRFRRSPIRWVALWSPLETEVSASLVDGICDSRRYWFVPVGRLVSPATGATSSRMAHRHDIDNFLSIGNSQAHRELPSA